MAKLRVVADNPTNAPVTPVPLNPMFCGVGKPSSVTMTFPLLVPVVEASNVTLMVQLPPAASVGPQVLVWAKSPLATMLTIFSVAVPLLVRVIVWGVLVMPVPQLPKFRLVELKSARGEAADENFATKPLGPAGEPVKVG